MRDVMHVTPAAKSGQGVVDDSASTLYRTPWYSTHGTSDKERCRPTVASVSTHAPPTQMAVSHQMCHTIQKNCVVFETHIDV